MYYLHRAGETTGPYAPGRLGMMLDAGEIAATDQVCGVGTEEWIPVEVVALAAPEPVKKKEMPIIVKRVPSSLFHWLAVLMVFAGFIGFFLVDFLVGGIVILLALVVGRLGYSCGKCGNKITVTSKICPTCGAHLVKRLPKKKG